MTVAPSSHPNGNPSSSSRAAASADAWPAEPTWLAHDLRQRVAEAAAAAGLSMAAICDQWVQEGLERYEAQRPSEDQDGSGRCSLRTGTCSIGPVPLPVQQ